MLAREWGRREGTAWRWQAKLLVENRSVLSSHLITNPPSIAPALPAASERSACVPGVTAMKGCDFEFCNGELIKFKAINQTREKTDVWVWH